MSTVDTRRLREIADQARAATELAMNRIDRPDSYVDQAIRDEAYATGVEDVLRYLAGDATPTEQLALVLRAGHPENDEEVEESLVGKTIARVGVGTAEGAYGDEPTTVLTFTDGTTHAFVHPKDD